MLISALAKLCSAIAKIDFWGDWGPGYVHNHFFNVSRNSQFLKNISRLPTFASTYLCYKPGSVLYVATQTCIDILKFTNILRPGCQVDFQEVDPIFQHLSMCVFIENYAGLCQNIQVCEFPLNTYRQYIPCFITSTGVSFCGTCTCR